MTVDPVVVDRLVQGRRVPEATSEERREAVARLHGQHVSQRAIAQQLHIDKRQVNRDLETLGLSDTGLLSQRQLTAALRRPIVKQLADAGCGRSEIARLLNMSAPAVDDDAAALGICLVNLKARGVFRARSLAELRDTYGHLLDPSETDATVASPDACVCACHGRPQPLPHRKPCCFHAQIDKFEGVLRS